MIVYKVKDELQAEFNQNKWLVVEAKITKAGNLMIEAENKEKKPIERIKLQVENPHISNVDFEIIGSNLKDLEILTYKRVFSAHYFEVKFVRLSKGGKYAEIRKHR